MNPAIVIVTFNRPTSLARLLNSISKGNYEYTDIPLVISIDYQDSEAHDECIRIAKNFKWQYGEKRIIEYKENQGLRKHILQCGDLTALYGSVIILEDDLLVSPNFYDFGLKASDFYKEEKNVAGISLYNYEYEELAWFKFYPMNNGSDIYYMQWASSWGQLWTKLHWDGFKNWYNLEKDLNLLNIPLQVKNWKNSWKKYFIAYLVDENKYFVYPQISFTTLIDEGGTHLSADTRTNHVSLMYSNDFIDFKFKSLDSSANKYDVFFQPCDRKLEVNNELINVSFDLFGTKSIENITSEYVVSIKSTKRNIFKFSSRLIPYELNIINELKGNVFNLTRKNDLIKYDLLGRSEKIYFLRKVYSMKEMLKVVMARFKNKYLQ